MQLHRQKISTVKVTSAEEQSKPTIDKRSLNKMNLYRVINGFKENQQTKVRHSVILLKYNEQAVTSYHYLWEKW